MKYGNYIDDYDGVKVIDSMGGLLTAEFNLHSPINAFVLPRKLEGDFDGLAVKLANLRRSKSGHINNQTEYRPKMFLESVRQLRMTDSEIVAAAQIYKDIIAVSQNLKPRLLLETPEYKPNSHKWHHDSSLGFSANIPSRVLCSYNAASTQFLENTDASHYKHNFYMQREGTEVKQFGYGEISKHIVAEEQDAQNWFIHRRPDTSKITTPRLLLAA